MRLFIGSRFACRCAAFVIALGIWWALTLVYPPLIIPRPADVLGKLSEIVFSSGMWRIVALTALRLLAGLALGVGVGTAAGILLGRFSALHAIFRPLLGVVQAVPLISWLVLALLWFGFNGRASVFIVAVAAMPVMLVNIVEGIRTIDPRLLQMARLYAFSPGKSLRHVVAPSVLPSFRAGAHVAVGLGCKTVIMGEVLTTASGIGGEITDARLNLEPETVVAWTIVVVVLYYCLDAVTARLLRGRRGSAC